MTGIYVRIKRGDRWENVEFDQMTDQELDEFTKAQRPEEGWNWARILARWIRENVYESPLGVIPEPTPLQSHEPAKQPDQPS